MPNTGTLKCYKYQEFIQYKRYETNHFIFKQLLKGAANIISIALRTVERGYWRCILQKLVDLQWIA